MKTGKYLSVCTRPILKSMLHVRDKTNTASELIRFPVLSFWGNLNRVDPFAPRKPLEVLDNSVGGDGVFPGEILDKKR